MGPQPPKPLEKVSPKKVREKVNELIKYAVAIHIDSIEFDAAKDDVKETPSGLTITLKG